MATARGERAGGSLISSVRVPSLELSCFPSQSVASPGYPGEIPQSLGQLCLCH